MKFSSLLNLAIFEAEYVIGEVNFGNVKMPKSPLEIDYPLHEQNTETYKIMVSSLFAASEKKVMEGLAVDFSKTRWKDS